MSPQVIGWMNDTVFSQYGLEAIRYSLVVVAIVGGLGSLFFLRAARTLREDLAAVVE